MDEVILPRLARFAPDMVLVSLGFDAAYMDPLGKMAVESGFYHAIAKLKAFCGSAAARPAAGLVVVLEGGYHPEALAQGVVSVAHALTFPTPYTAGPAPAAAPAYPLVPPRTWADLRQKQQRHHDQWQRLAAEGGGGEAPALVEADDAVLMQRHEAWCRQAMEELKHIHLGPSAA
ncbi:histone deacetylase 4 [Strigomonas culicis]|uniref:histone deacetylase n=1 Tax=Strigomonas culicis TaxID=28005 RepID=S9UA34_9TRYP|nr:histone deacetylase 4 [Strigomonas culicis]|eukprot:EPY27587.1 histone deacetylase 4 [Strigomonas culicis]